MSRRRTAVVMAAIGGIVATGVALSRLGQARLGAARTSMSRSSMPNARAYDWTSHLVYRPVFARIARTVARVAPAEASVLDIGCGPGQLAIRVAGQRPGLHVTGVDLDPAMIARAGAHAAREFALDDPAKPAFLVGDAAALPFADRSFDLAVSTFSLHHWSDPAAGFAELYRVLRPGGRVLIWDIAGPVRRIETTAPPIELARQSPFGAAEIGGRWSIGPLVLGERYDLLQPAVEEPTVDAGAKVTPITRRRSRPRARPTTESTSALAPDAADGAPGE
jgi:SAM-dependent methyltransferase